MDVPVQGHHGIRSGGTFLVTHRMDLCGNDAEISGGTTLRYFVLQANSTNHVQGPPK